jgi:hypothetical protein
VSLGNAATKSRYITAAAPKSPQRPARERSSRAGGAATRMLRPRVWSTPLLQIGSSGKTRTLSRRPARMIRTPRTAHRPSAARSSPPAREAERGRQKPTRKTNIGAASVRVT